MIVLSHLIKHKSSTWILVNFSSFSRITVMDILALGEFSEAPCSTCLSSPRKSGVFTCFHLSWKKKQNNLMNKEEIQHHQLAYNWILNDCFEERRLLSVLLNIFRLDDSLNLQNLGLSDVCLATIASEGEFHTRNQIAVSGWSIKNFFWGVNCIRFFTCRFILHMWCSFPMGILRMYLDIWVKIISHFLSNYALDFVWRRKVSRWLCSSFHVWYVLTWDIFLCLFCILICS